MHDKQSEFAVRGGWWVLAQVPVSLAAFLVPVFWGDSPFDDAHPVQTAGVVVTALGILFAVAGVMALGRALTPFPRPPASSRLRQSGIYAWVRHPIYGGHIIASIGWCAAWLSLPGLLFTAIAIVFFNSKIAIEEALLRARFPEYPAYALRVKKILPWIY